MLSLYTINFVTKQFAIFTFINEFESQLQNVEKLAYMFVCLFVLGFHTLSVTLPHAADAYL